MQRSDPDRDPDPAKSGRYRSRKRESVSPFPGTEPVTPTKRKASSPPPGIEGVHRVGAKLWAIEPGLTLQNCVRLMAHVPQKQGPEVLSDYLDFEQERLLSKVTKLVSQYTAFQMVDSAGPGNASPAEDRDKLTELQKRLSAFTSQQVSWRNIVEYTRQTLKNPQEWANRGANMQQLSDEAAGLQAQCETLIRKREDAHLRDLLSSGSAEPRGRTNQRRGRLPEVTPSPIPERVYPPGHRLPSVTPSPTSLPGAPEPTSSRSDDPMASGRGRARAETRSPAPPKRDSQGGRAQKRRSLISPQQANDYIEAQFFGIVERLGRTYLTVRELREAIIESIDAGSEWFVFSCEDVKEDGDLTALSRRVDDL